MHNKQNGKNHNRLCHDNLLFVLLLFASVDKDLNYIFLKIFFFKEIPNFAQNPLSTSKILSLIYLHWPTKI